MIELRKLLNEGHPAAQAAKKQFDADGDRNAFTRKAKEVVLQHRQKLAGAANPSTELASATKEPAASTVQAAERSPATKPSRERQQRQSKKDDTKTKKGNKKWEPKGGKKVSEQNGTENLAGGKSDASTEQENQKQEQEHPVSARRSPPGKFDQLL